MFLGHHQSHNVFNQIARAIAFDLLTLTAKKAVQQASARYARLSRTPARATNRSIEGKK
jgi:hypothetical protein